MWRVLLIMLNQKENKTIWDFFKSYWKYIVTLIVGIVLGICLQIPRFYIGKQDVLIKTDTITKEVVKFYTPLELKKNTHKIRVPQIKIGEYVFVKVDSLIFKDSVKYVSLPREYYYTKQDDIEIWHSGIDSRIDSLRYKTKETIITETYKRKDWKHEINIYGSIGYDYKFRTPVGVEYTYYPKKWIGVGTKVDFDVINHTPGMYIKTNFRFGW